MSWKALAVAVGGVVGGFAVYTFGWDNDGRQTRTHLITLRDGDVVLRPQAATRCEASGEGGRPNLFCTRLHGGRHQVIFYSDSVLVWPLARGPDGPPFSYLWTPYVLEATRQRQTIGELELRDLDHAVTYEDTIHAFGKPSSCRPLFGSPTDAQAEWRSLGLRMRLATLGGLPNGNTACAAPHFIHIHSAYVTGAQWQTTRGLKVDLPAAARATRPPRDSSRTCGRTGRGILLPSRSGRRVAPSDRPSESCPRRPSAGAARRRMTRTRPRRRS